MAASVIWDLLAPAYDRLRQSDRKTREIMYRRIRQVIRDRDVLEVGCGTGELACTTAVYARHMAAIDSSMGMLRQAEKKQGPKNLVFRPGDVYELPFGDGVFDVVIIADTLHVLNDPAKALHEISRVLKPGGVLIAPDLLYGQAEENSRRMIPGTVRRQWTEGEYLLFLQENGFAVNGYRILTGRPPRIYAECRRK